MMGTMVLRNEAIAIKLLVTGAAYLILLSIGISNSIHTNAKEIAMNITNTHNSSASTAELFFDKQLEKEKWNKEVQLKYPNSSILTIKDGIKHIKLTKYVNGRPIRLNIIEINKQINENIFFKPAMADDILNKKSQIKNIAQREQAIAAINGSYFKPQTGVPLGTMMIDGVLLTGPIYNRVALGIKKDGFLMDRLSLDAKLISKNNELKIDNINQPRMLSTYVIVYNEKWGMTAPPAPKYGISIAIKNGKVINSNNGSILIPEGGFIVSGPLAKLEPFLHSKNIKLHIKTGNNNWNDVEHIISGGPYLVKENEVFVDMSAQKLNSIGGRNPRTAIGYTLDNKFIMVTVDGREENSIGMTIMELAHFMKSIGCYNAMNLDGGGSSVMYINGNTVNNPAIKGGIPLSNALIIYEQTPVEKYAKVENFI